MRRKKAETLKAFFESTKTELNELVEALWLYDKGDIYWGCDGEDETKVLSTYNICGDKALHVCMLVAYSYGENSAERKVLLEVVKLLIDKCAQQYAQSINEPQNWLNYRCEDPLAHHHFTSHYEK